MLRLATKNLIHRIQNHVEMFVNLIVWNLDNKGQHFFICSILTFVWISFPIHVRKVSDVFIHFVSSIDVQTLGSKECHVLEKIFKRILSLIKHNISEKFNHFISVLERLCTVQKNNILLYNSQTSKKFHHKVLFFLWRTIPSLVLQLTHFSANSLCNIESGQW